MARHRAFRQSIDVEGRAYRIIHNSLEKTVVAMLKLDGTAKEIWDQIKHGTLQPRDELKFNLLSGLFQYAPY